MLAGVTQRTIVLSSLTAVAIVLAFLNQWFIVHYLGAGTQSDLYFASLTLPQLIGMLVSGSVGFVLVPLLAGETPERASGRTWTAMACVLVPVAGLTVVLASSVTIWAPLMFPGIDAGSELSQLCAIQLGSVVFNVAAAVAVAAYHGQSRFYWVAGSQVATAAASLALLPSAVSLHGVQGAAWLAVGRSVAQALLVVAGLGPVRFGADAQFRSELWRRVRPLLFGNAYLRFDILFDRYLSSMARPGDLSLYALAVQIYGAISQLVASAVTAPLIPALSVEKKEGRVPAASESYRWSFRLVLGAMAFVYLCAAFGGRPLLNAAARLGHLSAANAQQLHLILVCLGGVLIAGALGQVTSAVFYSAGNTSTPTRVGAIAFTLSLPMRWFGFKTAGISGLALGASAYVIASLLTQVVILKREQRRGLLVEVERSTSSSIGRG
jgi:putative peptidoglycan lipid II flippase